ncbi:macro domain-containing protein [Thiocapsa roseopersicina]|uniref:O-acetyl-ADP-ribose deacetylase (Regulator of RNase III), contains Macro domain n=1 Tax=Thiocapsa roseopersicina TaxID=1058 RepID=A0A1H3BKX1_THIRO|nr:macro domain-containing protein [Thiocapsa roseopersicina]SDX42603.1 O-acetyl-ADP-ribose deacetylase (regulator of RNase III), contains Macro domain [Thiocapsa roseopersicina]
MSQSIETSPRLLLVDRNPELVSVLALAFGAYPEVQVLEDDILRVAQGCLVSPANSAGFMDGGIDRLYLEFFGLDLQARVQDAIHRRYKGSMPVGAGLAVPTGHARIPYLIVAPTMASPERLEDARPSGMAMMAVLETAWRNRRVIDRVYCPGLGTGVGGLSPADAGAEMALAYGRWRTLRLGAGAHEAVSRTSGDPA